jgi:polar amino acid transport system substrate-binding protein
MGHRHRATRPCPGRQGGFNGEPLGQKSRLRCRAGTEFSDIASVDKVGVKIGTILGAPSDRVLTREIKAAEIVRIPLSPTIAGDAADLLRSGEANVFGADSGVGYPAAEALTGAKIVPGALDGSRDGCAAERPLSRCAVFKRAE